MVRIVNLSVLVRSALCAAVVLMLSASAALAQGLYYKEIAKDGRIYVFNVAANADRFEKTGEMGVGITKPGVGKDGETVVGDNERAIQLYFFKHGISEVMPEPAAPVQSIVWRDGKTRITMDNAYLELSNRVQVRFTEELPDDNTQLAGTAAKGDPRGSFRIRRAKMKLEGWMIKSWLTYEVQMNWPAVTGSNAGALLEDAAFDIDFSKGKGLFRAHIGQFKPPYGAQEMTSSGSQTFVDRALVSNSFFRGRDTGIALWGATAGNKIEWRVGMFNGNGPTRTVNDNSKFQYNARVMWQPNGSQVLNTRAWVSGPLYSESDFESTTAPIYAVAANWENQNNFNATAGNDQRWNAYSVDGIYKYKGFAVNGMYAFAQRTPETGAKFDATGGFVQAAKLFSRRRYEVAARYGTFDPTDLTDRNDTQEIRGAFSYYYARHGLKWQSDIGQIEIQAGTAPAVKTWELRSQLQFIF
ncbi:MAG: OprO/OprP family phosphate-selective porin [Acidobacteriota bacterium]|nr:OprO/OprP family phosphate-selective porin [Acidobacteriota bacterium]